MELNKIYQGDTLEVLKTFPDDFVDTIITSPPYWGLRDYGVEGQIGLEKTLEEYLNKMLAITKELKRVLKPTGVMFWNHGDCYSGGGGDFGTTGDLARESRQHRGPRAKLGIPVKSLCLQNYRLILKMIDEQGWILRNILVWHKPNHMPSSVKDRFANAYEPVFMLVKEKKYWFDLDAVRVGHTESGKQRARYKLASWETSSGKSSWVQTKDNKGRKKIDLNPAGKNPGDVWEIATQPFPQAHFATFPEKLVEPMIKSSCPQWICKKCGKARVRITEREQIERTDVYGGSKHKNKKKNYSHKRLQMMVKAGRKAGLPHDNPIPPLKTIGWTDCGCKAGWTAGVCLDPFIGSGTVGIVARKHGRNWIGIELSKEYIKIAEKRMKQQTLGI